MKENPVIAGATINPTPLDWEGNYNIMEQAIGDARSQGVDILCFPEMCVTGYGCEDWFLSDHTYERALAQVARLANSCANMAVCVGIPVKFGHARYNGMAVICDKKILGITLKQFLANEGVYYESRWFSPWLAHKTAEIDHEGNHIPIGDLTYTWCGIRFGFEICEDAWRNDQRTGHLLKERKVDLVFNPSASHFALGKSAQREAIACQGAAKFNCTYMVVNLLGNEAGRLIFDGDIILARDGEIAKANERLSFSSYQLLVAPWDEITPSPGITSSVAPNEEFARAVALALFDYLRKSTAGGFVLSLSGGADSACCAVLVSEMVKRGVSCLGNEAFCKELSIPVMAAGNDIAQRLLTCVYQASRHSSDSTEQAAETLAHSIGATYHSWSIDDQIDSNESKVSKVLGRPLTWEADDIARQNVQARVRSSPIWMLANQMHALLLTTSNRSEASVGYATMDGDTSGSLAPLAGIDKPFIRQWLLWAEKALTQAGLAKVNALTPTAELRPPGQQQTDENDLMPYDILVKIEQLAIGRHLSPVQVFQALKKDMEPTLLKSRIKKFYTLWSKNQWKRERIAPSFHLDSYNVDPKTWCRFPILSGGFDQELKELDNYQ